MWFLLLLSCSLPSKKSAFRANITEMSKGIGEEKRKVIYAIDADTSDGKVSCVFNPEIQEVEYFHKNEKKEDYEKWISKFVNWQFSKKLFNLGSEEQKRNSQLIYDKLHLLRLQDTPNKKAIIENINKLLDKDIDCDYRAAKFGIYPYNWTLLQWMISSLDFIPINLIDEYRALIFKLIKKGANVNILGFQYKVSPLDLARKHNDSQVINCLIKNGADKETKKLIRW